MSWNKVRLGDILTESKIESVASDPDKRITVRLNLKGVEKRPYEAGVEGATKYYVRKAGQFIYGKQNLFKGAFGIIPKGLDGFESSSDIPTFDINKDCLPEWLFYFLKQGDFYLSLESIATGTGSRRIQPSRLFEVEIPLPSIKEQNKIIDTCSLTETNYDKIIQELSLQQTYLEQLRHAILQEGVQGKLTKQNKDDEPADKLLQSIEAEKKKLITAGKPKKEKELPPIAEDEIPFELPNGWVWCRLEQLCNYIVDCPHSTPKFQSDGENCIDTTSMDQGIILFNRIRKVSKESFIERNRRLVPQADDIIFSREGTVGMAVLIPDNFPVCLGQRVMLFRTSPFVIPEYFRYAIVSPMFVRQWQSNHIGAASKHINIRDLRNYLLPLPSLSEQQRIVIKVQKLMQMVNQLEQQVAYSHTRAQQLLQAVLKEAFTSKEKVYEENEMITMAAEENE